MSYSTKEYCKICNVGKETLRYYEKQGLLRPRKNPKNHYRMYDDWDTSIVAEIRKYQAMGYPLSMRKKIFSN